MAARGGIFVSWVLLIGPVFYLPSAAPPQPYQTEYVVPLHPKRTPKLRLSIAAIHEIAVAPAASWAKGLATKKKRRRRASQNHWATSPCDIRISSCRRWGRTWIQGVLLALGLYSGVFTLSAECSPRKSARELFLSWSWRAALGFHVLVTVAMSRPMPFTGIHYLL